MLQPWQNRAEICKLWQRDTGIPCSGQIRIYPDESVEWDGHYKDASQYIACKTFCRVRGIVEPDKIPAAACKYVLYDFLTGLAPQLRPDGERRRTKPRKRWMVDIRRQWRVAWICSQSTNTLHPAFLIRNFLIRNPDSGSGFLKLRNPVSGRGQPSKGHCSGP